MAGTTPGVRAAQLTSPTLPPFAFRSSTRDITMLLSHQRDVETPSLRHGSRAKARRGQLCHELCTLDWCTLLQLYSFELTIISYII